MYINSFSAVKFLKTKNLLEFFCGHSPEKITKALICISIGNEWDVYMNWVLASVFSYIYICDFACFVVSYVLLQIANTHSLLSNNWSSL